MLRLMPAEGDRTSWSQQQWVLMLWVLWCCMTREAGSLFRGQVSLGWLPATPQGSPQQAATHRSLSEEHA